MENIIALVYDCDITLTPKYMQAPLLAKYGLDEEAFWNETGDMKRKEKDENRGMQAESAYLHLIIEGAREGGRFEGLTETVLKELGTKLEFYPGIPKFFETIKKEFEEELRYKAAGIKVEHYVVSSGLADMLRTSKIAPYMRHMEACEFFYDKKGKPIGVSNIMTPTEKTRLFYQIKKGVYNDRFINVDARVKSKEIIRVRPENMIYFGDGASDVPIMAVLKDHGG